MKKKVENGSEKSYSTFNVGIYCIYDSVAQLFDIPFACDDIYLDRYLSTLVNEDGSKYYGVESDYFVYRIGAFDKETAHIVQTDIERICILDMYVNSVKRKLQTIVKTLNYLPTGYFKMPEEMKKTIQEDIDKSITEYVSNYVLPDLDTSKLDLNREDLKVAIQKSLNS